MNHLDRGLVGSVSLTAKVQSLVPGGEGEFGTGVVFEQAGES